MSASNLPSREWARNVLQSTAAFSPYERDILNAYAAGRLHTDEEMAAIREALRDAVSMASQARRGYAGDHHVRTVQIDENRMERWAAALHSAADPPQSPPPQESGRHADAVERLYREKRDLKAAVNLMVEDMEATMERVDALEKIAFLLEPDKTKRIFGRLDALEGRAQLLEDDVYQLGAERRIAAEKREGGPG